MCMDAVDVKIIECLIANSRENASVIGSKVNMSVSAVIERIKKLESSGIIKQYTAVLNKEMLGMDLSAFVSVNLEHPKFSGAFVDFVANHPQIVECHCVTGDFSYLLKVCTENTKSLEKLVNEVKSVAGVISTFTQVVLSTQKEDFSPEIIAEQ